MKRVIRDTTLADRLLLIFLLTVSLSGIFIAREAVSKSSEVLIEVGGKAAYTLPLNADKTVTVGGPYGDTVVEVHDGKVRVKEAHCPNRICMKEGWVSRGVIVCLPNKIVITVGGTAHGPGGGVDAVTG